MITYRRDITINFFVLVFESAITVLLVYSFFHLRLFLIAHLLCLTVILTIIVFDIKRNRASEILFFLIVFTTLLGLIGPVFVLIIITVHKYILKDSKNIIENIKEIMNEDYYSESETLYNRLTFIKNSSSTYTNSEPFIDIMKYGSFYEKQQVLILVKRHFRPEFANILFNSLKNKDNSIRVEAASLMASLEKEATDKLKILKTKQINNNNVLSIGKRYLKFYEYYIETGILINNEHFNSFFDQIIVKLKELEKESKNSFYAYTLQSKILFKQKKYTEVIEILNSKVELEDLINDTENLEFLMESLFMKNRFSDIRNLARQALPRKQTNIQKNDKIISILKYWAT